MDMPLQESAPIVFFDGVCGLGKRQVDVLLRADRNGVLRFAAQQGETALHGGAADKPGQWMDTRTVFLFGFRFRGGRNPA